MKGTGLTEQEDHERKHWSLDKRVPLAVVIMLGLQFVAAVWWAANMTSTVQGHERRLAALEIIVQPLDGRLARIEVLLEIIARRMDRPNARDEAERGMP